MLPETMKRKEYMNMLKKYPDVLKIKEMCNALGGISTKTGYKLLRENKIESIKVGREYCITKISVVDFLMRKNKTTSWFFAFGTYCWYNSNVNDRCLFFLSKNKGGLKIEQKCNRNYTREERTVLCSHKLLWRKRGKEAEVVSDKTPRAGQ